MEELKQSISSRDWSKIAEQSHDLIGTSGIVGFEPLTEPLRELQLAARLRAPLATARQLEQLQALARRLVRPGFYRV